MTNLSLEDLAESLEEYDIEELCGVTIEGDIEIETSKGGGSSGVRLAIGQQVNQAALSLLNLARSIGYPVDSVLQMPDPHKH